MAPTPAGRHTMFQLPDLKDGRIDRSGKKKEDVRFLDSAVTRETMMLVVNDFVRVINGEAPQTTEAAWAQHLAEPVLAKLADLDKRVKALEPVKVIDLGDPEPPADPADPAAAGS